MLFPHRINYDESKCRSRRFITTKWKMVCILKFAANSWYVYWKVLGPEPWPRESRIQSASHGLTHHPTTPTGLFWITTLITIFCNICSSKPCLTVSNALNITKNMHRLAFPPSKTPDTVEVKDSRWSSVDKLFFWQNIVHKLINIIFERCVGDWSPH